MKTTIRLSKLCVILTVLLFIESNNVFAADVNCPAAPGTLQTAIDDAVSGEVINIAGNCTENVLIAKDRLTLNGSAIDGSSGVNGTILVGGAQRISLLNLTVKNANTNAGNTGNGVFIFQGAAVFLSGVTVTNNENIGVGVFDNAFARFSGGAINGNSGQGVLVSGNSRIGLVNGASITDNAAGGVLVLDGSSFSINGGSITNNSGQGISVSGSSRASVDDAGISLNSREGVLVTEGSSFFINAGTITNNGRQGILVSGSSRASVDHADVTLNSREGVLVTEGSSCSIRNSSNLTDNGRDGLSVTENASALIDDITISGNGRRAIQAFDRGFVRANSSHIQSDQPDTSPYLTISIRRGSSLRLGGDNTVLNTAADGGTAITITGGSTMRQSTLGSSGKDVISSTAGQVLGVTDQSFADLRNFELTGGVQVNRHSLLSLRKDPNGVVTGNIEVLRDSAVSFGLEEFGSVNVAGTVTCLDTESSVDLENQTAADIVGESGWGLRCTDYNQKKIKWWRHRDYGHSKDGKRDD